MDIRNYKEPNYKILDKEEYFEVREYSEMLVAQTTTAGTYKESSGQNFKRLAGYIFGNNAINENIPMTTPVLQQKKSEKMAMTVPVYQQQEASSWTMTFILPSKYTLETVPTPLDKKIYVKVLSNVKVATLQFNGSMNEGNIKQHTQKLKNWVKDKNYSVMATAYSASYDPPWTLPMLRRNEIHLPIE